MSYSLEFIENLPSSRVLGLIQGQDRNYVSGGDRFDRYSLAYIANHYNQLNPEDVPYFRNPAFQGLYMSEIQGNPGNSRIESIKNILNPPSNQMSQQELAKLDKRMHDPGFSMEMFLAQNEKFSDVYNRDLATLRRYNITCKQIGDRLEDLRAKYDRKSDLINSKQLFISPEEERLVNSALIPLPSNIAPDDLTPRPRGSMDSRYLIENRYIVTGLGTHGFQYCPFKYEIIKTGGGSKLESCGVGSADYVVYNTQTGQSLRFSDLAIHLIKDHCFFEGNVPYRVDPETAIQVLELQPGVNYEPQFKSKTTWSNNYSSSQIPPETNRSLFQSIPGYPNLSKRINEEGELEIINTNPSYDRKYNLTINGNLLERTISGVLNKYRPYTTQYVDL